MNEDSEKLKFTEIIIKDVGITMKAKFMLLQMLSKPKYTLFSIPDFADQSADKNTSIKTGFYELEETGYIIKSTVKTNTRRHNYTVDYNFFRN